MNIVFIGTVAIGYTVLQQLYELEETVSAVFTLPLAKKDAAAGFVDFEPLATAHGSRVIRTTDTNTREHILTIKALAPDLVIVCGWQRLICKEIIDTPRLGTIGFHSSLLPYYRGRAPVNWALLMGEKETGVTMFYLTPGVDDGDIIAQRRIPILLNDDCQTVYEKSAAHCAEMMATHLPAIAEERAPRMHNPSPTYPAYPKRTPADGRIDFNRSALEIYNFVRALTKPYPGAFFFDETGQKIIVWKIAIVFDPSRLRPGDLVFDTLDLKVRLLEWEKKEVV